MWHLSSKVPQAKSSTDISLSLRRLYGCFVNLDCHCNCNYSRRSFQYPCVLLFCFCFFLITLFWWNGSRLWEWYAVVFLIMSIPGNISFRPLTQFSVSMMSLLSNSYFFAETKVIWRTGKIVHYYYLGVQEDETRNTVIIQNQSSFAFPHYDLWERFSAFYLETGNWDRVTFSCYATDVILDTCIQDDCCVFSSLLDLILRHVDMYITTFNYLYQNLYT